VNPFISLQDEVGKREQVKSVVLGGAVGKSVVYWQLESVVQSLGRTQLCNEAYSNPPFPRHPKEM
jgi:hypothetical protein